METASRESFLAGVVICFYVRFPILLVVHCVLCLMNACFASMARVGHVRISKVVVSVGPTRVFTSLDLFPIARVAAAQQKGKLAVVRVSRFLICMYGDETVDLGLLRTKVRAGDMTCLPCGFSVHCKAPHARIHSAQL